MLGHLNVISPDLGKAVASAMGMSGMADVITPGVAPVTLKPSDALSIQKKAAKTLEGRKVGIFVTDICRAPAL